MARELKTCDVCGYQWFTREDAVNPAKVKCPRCLRNPQRDKRDRYSWHLQVDRMEPTRIEVRNVTNAVVRLLKKYAKEKRHVEVGLMDYGMLIKVR